jgi:hypothetical protein
LISRARKMREPGWPVNASHQGVRNQAIGFDVCRVRLRGLFRRRRCNDRPVTPGTLWTPDCISQRVQQPGQLGKAPFAHRGRERTLPTEPPLGIYLTTRTWEGRRPSGPLFSVRERQIVAAQLPFAGYHRRATIGRTSPYARSRLDGLPLNFNGRLLVQPGPTEDSYMRVL